MRLIQPLLILLSLMSAANSFGVPLYSDLADAVQYAPQSMPEAAVILAASQSDGRFTKGARYQAGLKLMQEPQTRADGSALYVAAAMMNVGGRLFYRKFNILVSGQPLKVIDVTTADIALSRMHFTANAGLVDRMVVVDDVADGIHLAFPLGVGGLDEGVMGSGDTLLTPLYQHATLNRSTVIPQGPPPYRGEPIMYISNSRGVNGGVAFHITLLSDATMKAKSLNYLVRGFESHACMRMRLKDLREFYTILTYGGSDPLPVNVDYFVWNLDGVGVREKAAGVLEEVHPYPFNDGSYMHVTYFSNQSPHYEIGPDKLVEMSRSKGQPDLSKLSAFNGSDQTSLRTFLARKAAMDADRLPAPTKMVSAPSVVNP